MVVVGSGGGAVVVGGGLGLRFGSRGFGLELSFGLPHTCYSALHRCHTSFFVREFDEG